MRLYESVLIARQDISTAQVETLVDEFSKIIENSLVLNSKMGRNSRVKTEKWHFQGHVRPTKALIVRKPNSKLKF